MIKLIKNTFHNEGETKEKLANFIKNAKILSMGEECKKFEEKFSSKHKRKFSVLVSSGSSANLCLIQSLINLGNISKGDKVAVSSLTWATNVMPLIQLGLKPIAVDCEITNLNVSKNNFEEIYEKNKDIKLLFLTNSLGFCANLDELEKFCEEKGIILLEDNCESLGSEIKGKLLGNFSIASTFSFFVGHHMSTIEGGMICTDDYELYHMLCMVRAHGWSRNLHGEKQKELRKDENISEFYEKYTFYELAYNLRPTEITGFLGNVQLNYLDEIVKKRDNNFKKFNLISNNNKDIFKLDMAHMSKVSNFSYPLIFKTKDLFEKYKKKFEENEIEIRPIIAGNIQKQPFYKKHGESAIENKNADIIHDNGFYFGNNPDLTEEEITKICSIINNDKNN